MSRGCQWKSDSAEFVVTFPTQRRLSESVFIPLIRVLDLWLFGVWSMSAAHVPVGSRLVVQRGRAGVPILRGGTADSCLPLAGD